MTHRIVKNMTRRLAWKILGDPPQPSQAPDPHPRFEVLSHAIRNISVNTRFAVKECQIGQPGSLLGDYLEFGTYEGATFSHVLRRAADQMPWMRFFAFDSFQGLPQLEGVDRNGAFKEGQYACSEEQFRCNVMQPGLDPNRVICVPGWYDQSLRPEVKQRHNLKLASIVHIDCDLYQSTVSVLRFITDLVETGTILLFDDWFCFNADPKRGVQRATAEWLADNPSIRLQEWHTYGDFCRSFFVVRNT